jgi:hypothetical protein
MDLIAASQRDFEDGARAGVSQTPAFCFWRDHAKQTAGRPRTTAHGLCWETMSDPKHTEEHPREHPDGDIGKGAVEEETPHSHSDNPYMHGQLGHRTSDEDIKDNDTDFPGPDAKEEHSGEKGAA